MQSRATIFASSFLSLLLFTPGAHAFCRSTTASDGTVDADGCPAEGQPLYWRNECIGLHLDEAASRYLGLDAARSLLVEAYSEWTLAGGQCVPSIQFVQLAPTSNAKVEYTKNGTNENDVLFHDDSWPYAAPESTLELVTTSFQEDTGELLDADVELNSARFPAFLSGVDGGASDPASVPAMKRLFMHAVGHVLGFAHSSDPTSIMYSEYAAGDQRPPVLTADDAAGICTVYPPSGERPTLDSHGAPLTVKATPCALGSPAVVGSCASSGALKLDHGCSVGPRSAPRSPGSLLAVALGVLLAAGLRRSARQVA